MLASGAAALMYQVLWLRLLSLSIGNTSAAIALVLTAFFSGLALGAWLSEQLSEHWTAKARTSIKPYLALEAIIGLSGLVLLPILLNLDSLIAQWGDISQANSIKFALVMLLLGIPTTAIGATFPLMVTFLNCGESSGEQLGRLYALNTAGGVLGAALCGFVFIPQWGLDGSTYIAAGLNFFIVGAGFWFATSLQANKPTTMPTSTQTNSEPRTRTRALIVLFGTGLVALACEVGWTKYLAIYTHTTFYGFAAILALFLTGIAIGSWVIKFQLDHIRHPDRWIAAGLLVLGCSLLLTRPGLNALPGIHATLTAGENNTEAIRYLLVFILLFPSTFLFGALFSLNLHIASDSTDSLSHPVGRAYAINTVGGIAGALGAGLWLIPSYGTNTVLTATASITLLLALLFVRPVSSKTGMKRYGLILSVSTLLLVIINLFLPPLDFRPLIHQASSEFEPKGTQGNTAAHFTFLQEGKSGVISVSRQNQSWFKIQKDGLPETVIHRHDPYFLLTETLLGLIPALMHPTADSALVIGLGGGTTAQALTLSKLDNIRVLELEPAILNAAQSIYDDRLPALTDARVELVFDDARQRLLLEDKHYDLIISQPSHPWLAGSANLFSREFFQLARSRLNDGGIYSQWVNLFHMDSNSLRSILQSFYSTFPYGMSFLIYKEGGLILLGSTDAIQPDYQSIRSQLSQAGMSAAFAPRDIRQPLDLWRYFALSREEALRAAGNMVANTDTNLLTEVRLGQSSKRAERSQDVQQDPYRLLRRFFQLDLHAYFPATQLAQRYQELVDYFPKWDAARAQLARRQLQLLTVANGSANQKPAPAPHLRPHVPQP